MKCTETLTGLTQNDAVARLAQDGYNELPSAKPRSLFGIAAKVVCEPRLMRLLVWAADTVCIVGAEATKRLRHR